MLSIVIPTLNEEVKLPKLVQNIKRVGIKDMEIIVSDGNSEDLTRQLAIANGCTVTSSSERHPSFQRNNGVKIAKGEIILFLDADTSLPDNFIQNALFKFKKRNLDIAGFFIRFDSKKWLYRMLEILYNYPVYILQKIQPNAVGAGIMVRKSIHEKIEGFNTTIKIGEDHDYARRASKVGKFGTISSPRVSFSVRRFKKEGVAKSSLQWIYLSIFFLVFGPRKDSKITYDFGKYNTNKK